MLYFAYCTLLDRDEMQRFCPTAQPAGTGHVCGYRVTFASYDTHGNKGGCQLEAQDGHAVYGLLYELSAAEFDHLDEISGVGQGFYQRIAVDVRLEDGTTIPATTYIIPSPTGAFRPSPAYVRTILAGARALQLPDEYVAELEATVAGAVR